MNFLQQLQKQAIDAAQRGDWDAAMRANATIVKDEPENISALNRLGFCYIQLEKKKLARETFERVLVLEKLNPVARKHVELLKKNQAVKTVCVDASQDFVEEPGKTKVVELHRLATPQVLAVLAIAQSCELKCKGRFVAVHTKSGEYIGSLPEDVSKHLSGLIHSGNLYDCLIKSIAKNSCEVFLKEKLRVEANKHIPSFFTSKAIVTFTDDVVIDPTEEGSESDAPETLENDFDEFTDTSDNDQKESIPLDVLGEVLEQ